MTNHVEKHVALAVAVIAQYRNYHGAILLGHEGEGDFMFQPAPEKAGGLSVEDGLVASGALVLARLLKFFPATAMHSVATSQNSGGLTGVKHIFKTNRAVALETLLHTGVVPKVFWQTSIAS